MEKFFSRECAPLTFHGKIWYNINNRERTL